MAVLVSSRIDFTPGFAITTLSNINLALFLIYLQIGCSLIGSLGALYNGISLLNLAISLFALVAIESSSQRLCLTYAFLLFSSILLDIAWFILFSHPIWNVSSDKYGMFFVFSVKLTLAMQIVGFTVRIKTLDSVTMDLLLVLKLLSYPNGLVGVSLLVTNAVLLEAARRSVHKLAASSYSASDQSAQSDVNLWRLLFLLTLHENSLQSRESVRRFANCSGSEISI
ncbi:hypothetical protein NC652_009958 [Populus alba x Populus x berolinensis]|nr:hypothetical protein NC652_009958 [Populus alba x Populus x berolinensis]